MRRILIDEKTANRANEFAGVMVNNTPQKVGWHKQQMPLERLKRFWVFLRGHHFVREAQYVYTIIFYYDTLLKLGQTGSKRFIRYGSNDGTIFSIHPLTTITKRKSSTSM